MKEITNTNLFIGTQDEIKTVIEDPQWRIVNLSSVFHKNYHMFHPTEERINPQHPCYVLHQDEKVISLNWVDASAKYFDYEGKGVGRVFTVIRFIKQATKDDKKVLITCDQGMSRSPSMALLFMALTDRIKNDSFQSAKKDFLYKFPGYKPSMGIEEFMSSHWSDFINA